MDDVKMEDEEKSRREERDPRDRRERRHHSDHWEPDDRKPDRRSSRRDKRSRSRSHSRHRSASPVRASRHRRRSHSRSPGRSRSRSRSRSPDHHRSSHRNGRSMGRDRERVPRSLGGPINADHEEAVEFAKISKRENRVYVGNLSYDVKYGDLIEFMRGAGEVLFAEVLVTPNGVSKGCGIVEFSTPEEAQNAIKELGEAPLLGRPVFIREDREAESRFGATPVPGKIGMALAHGGGFGSNPYGGPRALPNVGGPGNQLYVGNLPYQAGWQDLKDLFRSAGNIIRADINIGPDGRAKGSGTVIFETAKDAQAAIGMYHGFDWYGRTLEVREDRYAGLSGSGFRGRGLAAGGRGFGGRGLGLGGRGFGRGSFSTRGGGLGGGDGRQFTNDIYADYDGPNGTVGASHLRMEGAGYNNVGIPTGPHGYNAPAPGFGGYVSGEPSQQIMVRNLPWSTANEDLVELFETTGSVDQAEILFEGTRSKGAGVVQFSTTEESETAIAKFSGYMYGGRPLDVRFNDRWHQFTSTAAKGAHMQT